MRTTTIWNALSKVQHQIAEILPVHGGRFDARLRQEAKFAEILQQRMDERDSWRIPAAKWLELVKIGKELDYWNTNKLSYEKAAASAQKKLSEVSRRWQALTDLARGRAPAKGGIGATTTIYVDWGAANSTGETAA
jgi:hypothetical protein